MTESTIEWWSPEGKEDEETQSRRVSALLSETAKIEERQHAWHELNLWNSTLYNNRELAGFRWGAEANAESELWPQNLRTENIIENIGQAMLSKASSSPLKPTLVPHGNSWRTAKAIRMSDRFLFGAWRATKAEDACVQAFNDSYTAGISCVQVGYDDVANELQVESVFFDNIIIDNRECANRAMPRTYRIRKAMPRDVAESRYDIVFDEVKDVKRYNNKRMQGRDWVIVVEAWRLPDRGKKNGRHSIACQNYKKFIKDEPWTEAWVPLVVHHWQDRQSGFFVKSGVEQVIPFQVIQNELNDDIRDAQDLACRLRILAHANSNMDVSQLDNKNGRVIYYSGNEPKFWEAKTNLAELYNERERNKAAAYTHVGLSESFAGADLPPQVRLDSSAAVREQRNMEDSRHLRLWTTFEEFRLRVARTMLMVLGCCKGAENYEVRPIGARMSMEKIPWKDISVLLKNENLWTLESTPMSMMSAAARRELLRDYTSRGQSEMGGDDSKRMISNADTEMLEDLELADKEDIERHISIMEEGGYERPDEFTALSKGLMLVKANMKRLLQYDDVTPSDPVIRAHKTWLVDAASVIVENQKMQEAQQAAEQQTMTPFAPTQGVNGTSSAQGPAPKQ